MLMRRSWPALFYSDKHLDSSSFETLRRQNTAAQGDKSQWKGLSQIHVSVYWCYSWLKNMLAISEYEMLGLVALK
jgi:hypothetical protein